jgi:hypothetical protein
VRTVRTQALDAQQTRGAALLVVLLVLLALFALCVPFLWLSSTVDEASARLVDRTRARLALDDAAQHARLVLSATHPAVDATRDFDGPEEFDTTFHYDPALYDPLDETGVMWDVEVEDLAGRIDLASCSPHLLANLLGTATYLTGPVEPESETIPTAGDEGFPEAGYLYIGGEFIAYDKREGGTFAELERGLFSSNEDVCGPRRPSTHVYGEPVLSIEPIVFATWRISRGMQEARGLSFAELGDDLRPFLPPPRTPAGAAERDTDETATPGLPHDPLRDMAIVLDRTATLHGDVAATRRWQQPVRLLNDLSGGESCGLVVDDARWFAPGSTVRITTADGVEEFGLVRGIGRQGVVILEEPVRQNFVGRRSKVEVLARRPVNVNAATEEVLLALFENLSLAGRNQRITRSEARELVDLVIATRPFVGFQDFLERVVMPAGGIVRAQPGQTDEQARATPRSGIEPFLQTEDVVALYKNAQNANDSDLSFSTAPFAFVSRNVFSMDLRASINSEGRRERSALTRQQIELVAPGGELLHVWGRQEDFEEELRLDRTAPGWQTGPTPVSVFDERFGASPPPRSAAHLAISIDSQGGEAPVSRSVFASVEPDGYAKPWVVRADEAGPRQGRVRHFDRSQSDIEGFDLAQESLTFDPQQSPVEWADQNGLFTAGGLSFWFKLNATNGELFDSGTTSPDNDRFHAFVDGSDLVVEVLDAVGDHPDTVFEERARVRLPLAGSPVQTGVWSHLQVDVRGNQPDQIDVRVDGFGFGRRDAPVELEATGRTFLTAALSGNDTVITVESTEDFPDRCTLVIGNEVIEATKTGPTTFDAAHQIVGELAGYGGRLARELFEWQDVGDDVQLVNTALVSKDGSYPIGTQVRLWGYSAILASDVPPGGAELDGAIGPFSVARVVGVDGDLGAQISFAAPQLGIDIPIGRGFDLGQAQPQTIDLGAADQNQTPELAVRGFSPSGGFALLMQRRIGFTIPPGGGGLGEDVEEPETPFGTPLFGLKVVRYGGVQGTSLTGLDWNVTDALIPSLAGVYPNIGEVGVNRAFVLEWGGALANPDALNESLRAQVVCVPISLPCGANQVDFLTATPIIGAAYTDPNNVAAERGEFAQLTRTDDAEFTEWLRYDYIVEGHFVRAAPSALESMYLAFVIDIDEDIDINPGGGLGGGDDDDDDDEPGGGFETPVFAPQTGVEPSALVGAAAAEFASVSSNMSPNAAPVASPVHTNAIATNTPPTVYWQPELGTDELLDLPFTRSLSQAFQFRGVLGTHSHDHPDGTIVLPVWRVADSRDQSSDRGWLGRLDPVFVLSGAANDPGQGALVHRAWRANTEPGSVAVRPQSFWEPGPALTALETVEDLVSLQGVEWFSTQYVALDRELGVPYAPDPTPLQPGDNRLRNRVLKFPSGELPRLLGGLAFGRDLSGGSTAAVVIDELTFHGGASLPAGQSFGFVLAEDMDDQQDDLRIFHNAVRIPWDVLFFAPGSTVVNQMPLDGGLLRIGREIVAYQSYDESTGEIQIAENGRGMLGTDAGPHETWESVTFLPAVSVTTLSGGLSADDEYVPVVTSGGGLGGTSDFAGVGTLLIGEELLHTTWSDQAGFGMPRASREAGADDFRGPPLFRGRFGTTPIDHPAGTAVVRFETRYWDRWAPRADAPEMHHFTLQLSQPDAFLQSMFFVQDAVPDAAVRLGLLERTDTNIPWDADPTDTLGLALVYVADLEKMHAINRQIDRAEWRVFVEYRAGAFDPLDGLSTGWKQAPSLRQLGTVYLAPGRVIARRQR